MEPRRRRIGAAREISVDLLVRARSCAAPLAVLATSLVLFGLGASWRSVQHRDEFRYVEVAREMALPGASPWVPHLEGAVYTHKPPGFFWATVGVQRVTGLDLPAAGEAVSVLAGALCLMAVFVLGRRMVGLRAGLAAAVVLGSAAQFATLAKRASLDALLTALVAGALWAAWRARESQRTDPMAGPRWRLLAGTFAGLAVLVKGPVAVAVPAVVIGLSGRASVRTAVGRWLPALGVALAIPLAWLALAASEAGPSYAWQILSERAAGHPFGTGGKLRPWWFYLESFPVSFALWIALLPAAAMAAWRERSRETDRFLLAWSFAPLALLSLFPAKRHLYLLPALPGVALLVGAWLDRQTRTCIPGRTPWRVHGAAEIGLRLMGAVGVAAAAALVATLGLAGAGHPEWLPWPAPFLAAIEDAVRVYGASLGTFAAVVAGGLAFYGTGLARWPRGATGYRAVLGFGMASWLLLAGVLQPVESIGSDVGPFYERLAARLAPEDELLLFEGTDHAANLALDRTAPERVDRAEAEACLRRAERAGRRVWIVAEREILDRMGWPRGAWIADRAAPPLDDELVLLRGGVASGPFARRRLGSTPEPTARSQRRAVAATSPAFRPKRGGAGRILVRERAPRG